MFTVAKIERNQVDTSGVDDGEGIVKTALGIATRMTQVMAKLHTQPKGFERY